jgi:hypothetical protein
MNKAIVVKADDWEGLFINGICVQQGHSLNEGTERLEYFIGQSVYYNFVLTEVEFKECTDDYYDSYLSLEGRFPDNLDKVELEN